MAAAEFCQWQEDDSIKDGGFVTTLLPKVLSQQKG